MFSVTNLVVIVFSYLIGSISFGYLVGKYIGKIDIRRFGSGNVGTTNIWRTLGWKAGVIAFLGDAFKGMLAALVGLRFGGEGLAVLAGIMALIGHTYSIFLSFKGGKAVATGLGIITVLMPMVALGAFLLWVTILYLTKYVSLASIVAACSLPIMALVLSEPWQYLIFCLFGAIFVFYKHLPNIKRLRSGQEFKIGQKVKVK